MIGRAGRGFGVHAELDGTPESAHNARALVRHALGDSHPSADDAALIMSELVANAIAHSRSGQPGGTIIIAVETAESDSVTIQVRDSGSSAAPRVQGADISAENGRGLAIVSALAADWGSQASDAGRVTWCRLVQDRKHHSRAVDIGAHDRSDLNRVASRLSWPDAAAVPDSEPDRDCDIPDREGG